MSIILIVAVDSKNSISLNNKIPWNISNDNYFFQDMTKQGNNAIIMGKNTWKSLPIKALKDRINIVISTKMTEQELILDNITKTKAYLSNNLLNGIKLCQSINLDKIFICGGYNIYKEALEKNLVNEIYITKIDKDYNCDNNLEFFDDSIKKYKLYFNKTFLLFDKNNNEQVNVTFKKLTRLDIKKLNKEEQKYLNILENVLSNGHYRKTRNSNVLSSFGKVLKFNLSNGFPILTTKKVFFRGAVEELLFFLNGDTNSKHLSDLGVKIWNLNTSREFLDSIGLNHYEECDMGPMYGFQWLHYGTKYQGMNINYENQGLNQIEYCLNLLKTDPYSRRIIMTSYNPIQMNEGCLFPCHSLFMQWYVANNNRLCLSCYNRSQDLLLGTPFNIILSSLLVYLFCEVINNDINYKGLKYIPGDLIINLGDIHIYENQYTEVIRQILRDPYDFPKLIFKNKVTKLSEFKFDDIELINYQCYPNFLIKMIA